MRRAGQVQGLAHRTRGRRPGRAGIAARGDGDPEHRDGAGRRRRSTAPWTRRSPPATAGRRCARPARPASRSTPAYAVRDGAAVVELADVSGLRLLPHGTLAPLTAPARGTGEVIAAALDAGCRRLVLGIGGSASTDGGAGMLARARGPARSTPTAPSCRRAARPGRPRPGRPVRPAPAAGRRRGGGGQRCRQPAARARRAPPPCTGRRRAPARTMSARLDAALRHWADVVDAALGDTADPPGIPRRRARGRRRRRGRLRGHRRAAGRSSSRASS